MIIDLTPIRDGTGPARLLDMVPGRSKAVFKTWLAQRPGSWRDAVQVVAMDGFTGFKTATVEELPTATAVMDPFHAVRLAGDALVRCRRGSPRRASPRRCFHRGTSPHRLLVSLTQDRCLARPGLGVRAVALTSAGPSEERCNWRFHG